MAFPTEEMVAQAEAELFKHRLGCEFRTQVTYDDGYGNVTQSLIWKHGPAENQVQYLRAGDKVRI
jgi:hypothetical protein